MPAFRSWLTRGSCLALAAVLISPVAARAQSVGRASGTVRDLDGEPIKGATVTAENAEAAPRALTAVTDEKGRFSGSRPAPRNLEVHGAGAGIRRSLRARLDPDAAPQSADDLYARADT